MCGVHTRVLSRQKMCMCLECWSYTLLSLNTPFFCSKAGGITLRNIHVVDVEPESRHTQGGFLHCFLLRWNSWVIKPRWTLLFDELFVPVVCWEDSVMLTKAVSSSIYSISRTAFEVDISLYLILHSTLVCSIFQVWQIFSFLYLVSVKTPISLWRWKTPNGSKGTQNHLYQANSSSCLSGTLWEFHSAPAMVLIYLELW